MCYVTSQIDRYLEQQDREDARDEWLARSASADEYKKYRDDAMEQISGLDAQDQQSLEDVGEFYELSASGKAAVLELAEELAAANNYRRYE